MIETPQFNSLMMAGFECTYALAENGRRFDLLHASRHDEMIQEDYELLRQKNIFTVREGLAWHEIDLGNNVYDFSRFERMMQVAHDMGFQQIWDLCHFDFPADLDPFSAEFPKRFGEYAKKVIEVIRKYQTGTIYICPMNEASFFAWMCDQGLWAPYQKGQGTSFKKQLIKSAITAMKAIWEVDKNVQFMHVDPYMFRMPLHRRGERNKIEADFCQHFNQHVRFQSWDMIAGKVSPELGGDPKYLNHLGLNYYFYNQQQVGADVTEKDKYYFRSVSLKSPIRLSLNDILNEVYQRYGVPMILSETGSYRDRRPAWWQYIIQEVQKALDQKLPLYGVCSYPTLDILSGAGFIIPKSGLFDFDQETKNFARIPHQPTWKIIDDFIAGNPRLPS